MKFLAAVILTLALTATAQAAGRYPVGNGWANWGWSRQPVRNTVIPIQPLQPVRQPRPKAETHTAPPSFVINGTRYVIME